MGPHTSATGNNLLNLWTHLPGLHWAVDIHFTLVAISNDYLTLLGETKEAVLQKDIFTLFQHPPYAQLVGGIFLLRASLKKVQKTKKEIRGTGQKDASLHPHEPSKALNLLYLPVMDENHQVACIIHQASEVTSLDKDQKIIEIEKSRQIYRTLAASLPHGAAFIVDHNLRYILAEGQALRDAKMKPSDLEGKTIREAIDADMAQLFEQYYRQALAGDFFRLEHENQSYHYVTYGTPLRNEQGEIYAALGISYDVTERNQTEEALRQSEKHLSAIFANASVGISEISLDGHFIRVNEKICQMLGRSREALLSVSVFDITYPEDVSKSKSVIKSLIESGKAVSFDNRYLRQDNTIVWGNSLLTRLDDAQGHPKTLLAITVDLTERRQAEEAHRQSEERLKLIMESARDYAIFTMDKEGNINSWNTGAQQLTGYTAQEVKGKSVRIIFTPKDRKKKVPEKKLQKALEQGRIEDERWYLRKDGTQFYSMGVLMSLRDKNNKILGFLKIMRDHTERMQMEEALKLAKNEAEQAARAKEDFLAHMSHEIRTPVNTVIGLSHLLLQQNPRSDQLENLQTLKFSAENLRLLVNDILDFSKIKSGKVTLEENEVNLQILLHNLHKAHQLHALEKGNELQFYFDEHIPEMVYTDQLKLSQVMQNLINNAVKFTKNGIVKVEVHLNRKHKDKVWLDFSVSDTGIGIPQDKLSSIFDIFTQADNSTVREYGGTGLGLSISKWLLELMNSHIGVESQKGLGSRFFFTLPVKVAEESNLKYTEYQEAQTDLSHINLLLVEDMDINRQLLKQFFIYWWEVTPDEATNGEEAIKMAQKEQYDLILMDVHMPVMDGYQATKAIRNLPNNIYQQVPIIALTADTLNEVEKHPEAGLFTDVITKPFNYEDLQQKLASYAPRKK